MKTLILGLLISTKALAVWTIPNTRGEKPPFQVTAEEAKRFAQIEELANELHAVVESKRTTPLKRLQHHKIHGCLKGKFQIIPNLTPSFETTLFKAGKEYDVFARYSNIGKDDDSERDLRGLGVKVIDPTQSGLLGQDFLANDTPHHFINVPEDLLEFLHFINGKRPLLDPNTPYLLNLVKDAAIQSFKRHSLLEAPYFSRTHFKFGSHQVRYGFFQCANKDYSDVVRGFNHLGTNLQAEAKSRELCLELKIQVFNPQTGDVVNRYTEEWSTPYQTVAKLTFPKQDPKANPKLCESLSFDPWRSLPEHAPLGILNKARWYIYKSSRVESHKQK